MTREKLIRGNFFKKEVLFFTFLRILHLTWKCRHPSFPDFRNRTKIIKKHEKFLKQ